MQRKPTDAAQDGVRALALSLVRRVGVTGALAYARAESMAGVEAAVLALEENDIAANPLPRAA